jgi:hypothetical protein
MGVSVVHQYCYDCDKSGCDTFLVVNIWPDVGGGRKSADKEARENGWFVAKQVLCPGHLRHALGLIDSG